MIQEESRYRPLLNLKNKMKRIVLVFFLLLGSCSFSGMSCIPPSEYYKNQAQSYYDSFSSYRVIDPQLHSRLRKIEEFKCYYRAGDQFYAYKTFFDTKYILVRYGTAITYIEE